MSKQKFPTNCLTLVFNLVDRKELYNCALVSKHLASIALPLIWQDPFPVITVDSRRQFQFVQTCLQCIESTPFLMASLNITFIKRRPYYTYIKFLQNLEFCLFYAYVLRWIEREQSAHAPITAKFERFFAKLTGSNQGEPRAIASIIVQRIADRCASLQCLSVRSAPVTSNDEVDPTLSISSNVFSHITELIWFVPHNSELALKQMATICTSLRSITVASLAQEDDEAVAALVRAQKNLKELKLGLNSDHWRRTIAALETQASTIEVVRFVSVHFRSQYPLEGLAKCTQLRSLIFSDCVGMCDEVFAPLLYARLPRLQHLEFDLEETPEDAAEVLIRGAFASLERLAFKHSGSLLLAGEQCPHLTHLITTVSETEFNELKYLLTCLSSQLEGLGLKGTYKNESCNMDWLLRLFGKLHFPKLTYLCLGPDVSFSPVAMDGFLASSQPPLRAIDLVTSFPLTDEYLTTLMSHFGQTLNALEIISSEKPLYISRSYRLGAEKYFQFSTRHPIVDDSRIVDNAHTVKRTLFFISIVNFVTFASSYKCQAISRTLCVCVCVNI
jgi:hypothetical protein